MRLSSLLIVVSTFVIAALLSVVVASFSADIIEESSERAVFSTLEEKDMLWVEVHAEGLQVFLAGVAPTEAQRFNALSTAGAVVDAARLIDNMQVEATADIAPPRFSLEILRNDSGISLIGLIPHGSDRDQIVDDMRDLVGHEKVTDLLEAAAYEVPEGWEQALKFGLNALELLPRSKISVEAGHVTIHAMSDSPKDRNAIEKKLTRRIPSGLKLDLDISAPRPVITPFSLRFLIDENGPRFDSCSADTESARTQILSAAGTVGMTDTASCTIGLGVPSPKWAQAVTIGIQGLHDLGGGTITFSDADVSLVAQVGTDQGQFDRVVGELESRLPDIFALHSSLPVAVEGTDSDTPEFVATLSPEGLVQLRGRMRDDLSRATTTSYAQARFGSDRIYMAARLDDTLPTNWSVRVTTGLDALSKLHHGTLTVTPETVTLFGKTGSPEANSVISQLLAEKLRQGDQFEINVTYLEELDPIASLPKPEDCVASIGAILKAQKITFEPGSGTLDKTADPIIADIAKVLVECGQLKLEIQGHTDSQGREGMNQALSQTRAQSVLNALHDRRILTSGLSAKGYGETTPIQSNDTETGREANRRIEFVLITPDADDTETTLESTEQSVEESTQAVKEDAPSTSEPKQEPKADDKN